MNDDYSQAGQDKFVMSLINDNTKHFFLDVGCHLPRHLNNTLLLEENGWKGLSIDILDFHQEWESQRNTKFVRADALTLDYNSLLNAIGLPMLIDYLNVDIEGEGLRFQALKQVFTSGREFKIITIEHDRYRGYTESEVKPQRDFLIDRGYECICEDVCASGNPFEDWWVNPKYLDTNEYQHLYSVNEDYNNILKKIK
jgi:hypothetical protein